jgi:hypothetical protein
MKKSEEEKKLQWNIIEQKDRTKKSEKENRNKTEKKKKRRKRNF